MDERRSSSELTGSEARHNTPIPSPLGYPNFREKDGDVENEDGMPSRNIDASNEVKLVNSYGELASVVKTSSHFSKLNSASNLPRLVRECKRPGSKGQICYTKKRLHSPQELGPSYQSKDLMIRDHPFDLQENTPRTTGIIHDFRTDKKSAISLPKIDTYCISHARPNTNHGFSYMVCATDLIKAKNSTGRKRLGDKSLPQTYRKSSPENDFCLNSSNLYLLFRAPSRVCGPNLHPFTVRTKPKGTRQNKRGKKLKESKEVKTNVIRLPDINEEVWK